LEESLPVLNLSDDRLLKGPGPLARMKPVDDLPRGTPERFLTIIEIPQNSRNKYEIDKETGLLKLDRVLHATVHYPADYGFVPQTHWDDGDPLDVLVLTRFPVPPLTIVECRAIGVVDMVDGGDSDAKIIAVPVDDVFYKHHDDIADIDQHEVTEIVHFFETYKLLERKKVEITGVRGKAAALETVRRAFALYDERKR
jgi:inorganic pyrophosphatase